MQCSLRRAGLLAARLCHALLLFCAVTAHAQSAAVQQTFQQGATALHNGQLKQAEQAFRSAVRLAPDLAEAHLDLGLVLGREGQFADAVASIQHALSLNPTLPSARMFLGIFQFQSNHTSEARAALREELQAHPDNVEAMVWLANVELASANPAAAAAVLDRAAELQPTNLDILELRGNAHSEAAKDSYSRMAALNPDSWHVHRVRAQLLSSEGKHAEAAAEYQAAIAQQKNNPDLYEGMGDEYRAASQLDAAENAYRAEQQLAPGNPIALYNLGSTEVERGDAASGVALLQKANEFYPDHPTVEYYLGRGLAQLGQSEQAAAVLTRAANGDKQGEIGKRSFFELARVERKLHHDAEAQAATAEYNRIRLQQESKNEQQVRDWRKLSSQPASTASPGAAAPQ